MDRSNQRHFFFELWMRNEQVLGEAIEPKLFYSNLPDYAAVMHRETEQRHYHVGWKDDKVTQLGAKWFIDQFEAGKVTILQIDVE